MGRVGRNNMEDNCIISSKKRFREELIMVVGSFCLTSSCMRDNKSDTINKNNNNRSDNNASNNKNNNKNTNTNNNKRNNKRES